MYNNCFIEFKYFVLTYLLNNLQLKFSLQQINNSNEIKLKTNLEKNTVKSKTFQTNIF